MSAQLKCRSVNPATCRFHRTTPLKGLDDYTEPKSVDILETFNKDYEFSRLFLSEQQQSSIIRYMELGYLPINQSLRDPEGFAKTRLSRAVTQAQIERVYAFIGETETHIKNLDSAFQAVPVLKNRTLYRYEQVVGTSEAGDREEDSFIRNRHLEALKRTGEVTFQSFLSTSVDSHVVNNHIRGDESNGYIAYRILTPKGLPVMKTVTSAQETERTQVLEREILLPRNQTFKVENIRELTYLPSNRWEQERQIPQKIWTVDLSSDTLDS